jgi:hypothetical protein
MAGSWNNRTKQEAAVAIQWQSKHVSTTVNEITTREEPWK